MSKIPPQRLISKGDVNVPQEEKGFLGYRVEQGDSATPLVKESSNTWLNSFNLMASFLMRKMGASVNVYHPSLPCIDEAEDTSAILSSLGAYLNECKELNVEPKFPESLKLEELAESLIGVDPQQLHESQRTAYWAIECFYGEELSLVIDVSLNGLRIIDRALQANPDRRYLWEIESYALDNIELLEDLEVLRRQDVGVALIAQLLAGNEYFNGDNRSSHREFLCSFINKNLDYYHGLSSKHLDDSNTRLRVKNFFRTLNEVKKCKERILFFTDKIDNILTKIDAGESLLRSEKITRGEFFLFLEKVEGYEKLLKEVNLESLLKWDRGDAALELANKMELVSLEPSILAAEGLSTRFLQSMKLKTGDILRLGTQGVSQLFAQGRHIEAIAVEGGMPRMSGINSRYALQDIPILWPFKSDFFRLIPSALIDTLYESLLEKTYGDDWRECVDCLFEESEKKFHLGTNSKKYFSGKGLAFSPEHASSVMNATMVGRFVGPNISYRSSERKPDSVWKKVTMGDYGNLAQERKKMLCSAFVARSIEAAIYDLNLKLFKKLNEEGYNLPEGTIIVHSPFSSVEKFGFMSPDRLAQVLSKEGCVQEVGQDFLKKVFRRDK